MPWSHVATYSDPYELAAGIRGVDADFVFTSKGDFRAEIVTIDLNRLWMMRTDETLPAILRETITSDRVTITLPSAPMYLYGKELMPGEILAWGRGTPSHLRMPRSLNCASMSLMLEDLAAAGIAIAGRELASPLESEILRPAPESFARLSALHQAAVQLARTAPGLLADPAIAKALEQELVHAMIACVASRAPVEARHALARHSKIIARFEDFLDERRFEPVYLGEICSSIGASERTLRQCCQERFGVGPVRYLRLRRMNLARRALLHGDPNGTTVTAVATESGFWELGRFSVEYRALFGESPSETLQRSSARSSSHESPRTTGTPGADVLQAWAAASSATKRANSVSGRRNTMPIKPPTTATMPQMKKPRL